jgi:indolepyruvate ferredoxin oxidoreductase beta subunit
MKDTINFLLAGVGGQGTILASDILANVGLAAGYHAKQAEVHGMSQRGGSVLSHVRWGKIIHSPLVGAGETDVFLAFEKVEALRNINTLHSATLALINLEAILPVSVSSEGKTYPSDDHLRTTFARVTPLAFYIDGPGIARSLGNPRVSNIVLLGALSFHMEQHGLVGVELHVETWLEVISERVPAKTVDLNHQAFIKGRQISATPTQLRARTPGVFR